MSDGKPKCSYFGCEFFIADSEINSKDAMKFCETHLEEVNKLMYCLDPKKILAFWVRAQGGAKRAADRLLHGDKNEQ
jgi:hypothetical protein